VQSHFHVATKKRIHYRPQNLSDVGSVQAKQPRVKAHSIKLYVRLIQLPQHETDLRCPKSSRVLGFGRKRLWWIRWSGDACWMMYTIIVSVLISFLPHRYYSFNVPPST